MAGRTNGCCGSFWARIGTFFRNTGHQIRNAFSCCRVRNTAERPQTAKAELTSKQRSELAKIILQTVPSKESPIAIASSKLRHVQFETKDITTVTNCNAIVNPAVPSLSGGSGIDEAIHDAAGPLLFNACQAFAKDANGIRCAVGSAVRTDAFRLNANGVQHIIHAVGPDLRPMKVQLATENRETLLALARQQLSDTYRNAFALARQHNCRTVALPPICCGVYQFPAAEAAHYALLECSKPENQKLKITFCFLQQDEEIKDAFIAAKHALEEEEKNTPP